MPFHYGFTRPSQLGYADDYPTSTVLIMLDCYVVNVDDLAHVERCIRQRRWGNLIQEQFFLKVWTNYSNTQDPSNPYDGVFSLVPLYAANGSPITSPAASIIRNQMLGA
jgi:hypothetical protein